MEFYFLASAIAVLVSVALVGLVRRNLAQRAKARRLRAVFIAIADDLVSKSDLPDRPAKQLVEMSLIPAGWLTRYMVASLLKRIVFGGSKSSAATVPLLDQVPVNLRAKYVAALLSLAWSDTYRCAILGRVWRGAYSWIGEALAEVKPDVDAHATRDLIIDMGQVHAPRQFQRSIERLECPA